MANNIISNWFPVTKENWGLDAVTLLAVIGEAAMADNAQPMTASVLCLLPRILPAPQTLLKPTRPARLPTYIANVAGIYNGVRMGSVRFFANIIHPLEDAKHYSLKVIEITHADQAQDAPAGAFQKRMSSWSAYLLPGGLADASTSTTKTPKPTVSEDESGPDLERGSAQLSPTQGIHRRRTAKEKLTAFVANPTLKPRTRPAVPPALTSPIHLLTVFSFALTLVIFGLTAYWRDGNAFIAIFIISLQASLVGYASWWRPTLMVRPPHQGPVPAADMMIRTREASFILIKCNDDVARELYTGAEECEYYVGPTWYRFLMALGTMLLMVGVVLLGNTKFNAQAIISASYILLNGAYWLLGMVPQKYFWDMSRYKWREVDVPDARDADKHTEHLSGVEAYPSFTRTLWYAIRETGGQIGWVERSGSAPDTPGWRRWLQEASENAKRGNRSWSAVQRKDEIMKEAAAAGPSSPGETHVEDAEQRAPMTETKLTREAGVTRSSAF